MRFIVGACVRLEGDNRFPLLHYAPIQPYFALEFNLFEYS